MSILRVSVGLLIVATVGACSSSFWDRSPRVGGRIQPGACAAAPSCAVPPPRTQCLPAPATRCVPPPAVSAPMCDADTEREILGHVNQIRRSMGLRPFALSPALHLAARAHSEEQNRYGYMGHESPDPQRRSLVQRMHLAGYRGVMYGEVVAWGYDTTQAVVEGWMNSSEHRAILVDSDLMEAGFSRVGKYWTGNFGSPRTAHPPVRAMPSPTRRAYVAPPASRSLPGPTLPPRTYRAPSVPAARPNPMTPRPTRRVQDLFTPAAPMPAPAPSYRAPARGG